MCLALGPGSDSSYAAPTGGLSGGRGSTVLSCSPIARIGPFRVCSGRVTCRRGPATDAPRRPSHPWARGPPARRRCAGFGTQSVHETLVPLECRTFRHQNVIHGWPLLPLARSPSRRALDQLAGPELIMSAGGRSVDRLSDEPSVARYVALQAVPGEPQSKAQADVLVLLSSWLADEEVAALAELVRQASAGPRAGRATA
jgi:hypothetical protein